MPLKPYNPSVSGHMYHLNTDSAESHGKLSAFLSTGNGFAVNVERITCRQCQKGDERACLQKLLGFLCV